MHQVKNLGHEEAETAIRVIRDKLLKGKKAAVITVVDAHGELIAMLRLNGAPLPSILNAQNKAYTAAREGIPSRDLGQAARDPKDGFDMAYFGDSRYIGWGGGVPVEIDGQILGAVGVSGLPEEEDMDLAKLGVAVITRDHLRAEGKMI